MDKSRLAAEEIVKKYFDLPIMGRDGNDVQDLIDRVTSALIRAREEGFEDAKNQYQLILDGTDKEKYEEGFKRGVEEAAKVAAEYETDFWNRGMLERIANEIRELKRRNRNEQTRNN